MKKIVIVVMMWLCLGGFVYGQPISSQEQLVDVLVYCPQTEAANGAYWKGLVKEGEVYFDTRTLMVLFGRKEVQNMSKDQKDIVSYEGKTYSSVREVAHALGTVTFGVQDGIDSILVVLPIRPIPDVGQIDKLTVYTKEQPKQGILIENQEVIVAFGKMINSGVRLNGMIDMSGWPEYTVKIEQGNGEKVFNLYVHKDEQGVYSGLYLTGEDTQTPYMLEGKYIQSFLQSMGNE
ncbi:MAG: hypothetical protein ACRCTE_09685 [Cellulosilyticaceae bacterium]